MRYVLLFAAALCAGCKTTLTATLISEETADAYFISRVYGAYYAGVAKANTPFAYAWKAAWLSRDIGQPMQFWLLSKTGEKVAKIAAQPGSTKKVYRGWFHNITRQDKVAVQRKITTAMTFSHVQAAWGSPYKITNTNTSYSTSTTWTYGNFPYNWTWVYFTNGLVTSWHQSTEH